MKTPATFSSAVIHRLALLAAPLLIGGSMSLAADEAPAKPPQPEAQTKRLISLVLLLSEPRTLDAGAIAHAVSHAVGSEVSEEAVTAKPPSFVVKAGPRFEVLAQNPMGEICMATRSGAPGSAKNRRAIVPSLAARYAIDLAPHKAG